MLALRPSPRWLKDKSAYNAKLIQQTLKQRLAETGRKLERSSSIPVICSCPAPTCDCADMPPDLDIDQSKDLNGTMAAYSQQILISTGQADWKSKIEDESDTSSWGSLVAQIKSLLGPKGRFHDPYRNVTVNASSFVSRAGPNVEQPEVLLFPSFQAVSGVDPSEQTVREFLESFVLAKEAGSSTWKGTVRPISAPTILVCSHNSRDSRCGILGPLLHAEFIQYLNKRHTLRNDHEGTYSLEEGHASSHQQVSFASHPEFRPDALDASSKDHQPVNVGMISHIGGHKWAGNVIVYIPPDYKLHAVDRQHRGARPQDSQVSGTKEPFVPADQPLLPEEKQPSLSPLAGKGIWYGRVQPKHVEGIVEQTIAQGHVIRDLFRGGINQNGSVLRLV